MRLFQSQIPSAIESQLPEIRAQLVHYLELEESQPFSEDDLAYKAHLTAEHASHFVIFEYVDDEDETCLAFFQYPTANGRYDGYYGSWPLTPGKSTEFAILEYLQYNPQTIGKRRIE